MSTEAPSLGTNPLDAVRCHSKTDIGQKREENQDSFGSVTNDNFKFYFVCDGMGGVKGGAVASQLAVSVIDEACKNFSLLDIDSIRSAVADANASIFERGSNDEQLSGMGTTFVGLAFIGTKFLITSVGDSRAYRVRNGEISQLTEDHTLVMELLRSGSITEEQAVNHPVSHMLTRSLGPAPEIEIDCWESSEAPAPGDKYLLCSDGLYNMLGIEELGEVILSLPPEEAVEELISLANLRGGHDNITVMLMSVDDSYPEPTAQNIAAKNKDYNSQNGASSSTHRDRLSDDYDDGYVADTSDGANEGEATNGLEDVKEDPDAKIATELNAEQNTKTGFTLKNRADPRFQTDLSAVLKPSVKLDGQGAVSSKNKTNARTPQNSATSGNSAGSQGAKSDGPVAKSSLEKNTNRPNAQAKLIVLLVAGFAGAYLLGHLHGATDEDTQIIARQANQLSLDKAEQGAPSNNERQIAPIAVAPVAIQPSEQITNDNPASDSAPEEQRVENSVSNLIVANKTTQAQPQNSLDYQGEDRRQELMGTIADLEQKLAAFRNPMTGKAGEMLKASTGQIERISRELDATRSQIDSSTRALTIWLGRKKRLQSGDPINLASEVAISSEAVKSKQDAFNLSTYAFLQENEVLRFNPGDNARERKVADLARQRLTAMRDLIDSVKIAIQEELAKVEKAIESSTLGRVDLEGQLEQARRDVEYVKALAGSDVRAREAKQLELRRYLDVARAELEEMSRQNS